MRCRWETAAGIPWGCCGQEILDLTPLPARCLPIACLWEGLGLGITPAASTPGAVSSWVLPSMLHHDHPQPRLGRFFSPAQS